ncbi:MAG: prepilin-type N-terminal cleavage/methylation domain-containing protein [Gemmatimonadetes bacterium]|nr:prepilin-type N-terminal cleavage/methylation domain-containing protein [Gemmatimonadota bacterium]
MSMRRVTRPGRRGFSLIEVVVAMTIFLVILSFSLPFFNSQSRAVSRASGQGDMVRGLQFAISQLDRDLRMAGAGTYTQQPMLVQIAPLAITFNVNSSSPDSADVRAVYWDPDADPLTQVSLTTANKITLPTSGSKTYPDTNYVIGGILSAAETISYWFSADSSTTRTDDYIMWRRENQTAPTIVLKGHHDHHLGPAAALPHRADPRRAGRHGRLRDDRLGARRERDAHRLLRRQPVRLAHPDGDGLDPRRQPGARQPDHLRRPADLRPVRERDRADQPAARRAAVESRRGRGVGGEGHRAVRDLPSHAGADRVRRAVRVHRGRAWQLHVRGHRRPVGRPVDLRRGRARLQPRPVVAVHHRHPIHPMSPSARMSPPGRAATRPRRGVALILTMILTVAFAALAMGAIYMTGNASLIGSSYDRERDYRYAAEAALGIAKSQLNGGLFILPDSNYATIMSGATITGADGLPLPRVLVNLYVGPTGSTSGQYGTFGSIVAEATDGSGARYVRRLELTQETFAKFAYFSVNENSPTSGIIYFGGGDVIFGPLFTNDTINILSGSCPVVTFKDQVQTAQIVNNAACATFSAYGYQTNVQPIPLPTNSKLAVLTNYSNPANFTFTARPANWYITPPGASLYNPPDSVSLVQTRIEFVNWDLDADGSSADPQDGFFRVYETLASPLTATLGATPDSLVPINPPDLGTWVRGDPPAAWSGAVTGSGVPYGSDYTMRWDLVDKRYVNNCGDWHTTGTGASRMPRFFPIALHRMSVTWFRTLLSTSAASGGAGMTVAADTLHLKQSVVALMTNAVGGAGANNEGVQRCYLGGDPHLVAIERYGVGSYTAADYGKGGDDTTFTPTGRWGRWRTYPGTIDTRLTSGGGARADANYLFPLFRGINNGSAGVIVVSGSVGISGVLRGRVTLYANGGNVVILDNMKYAIAPAAANCLGERDILGVIAGRNVMLAANTLLDPQLPVTGGSWANNAYKSYNPGPPGTSPTAGTTTGVTLHGVMMTLNNSFKVEGVRGGGMQPTIATCGGSNSGRGCLNLTGGILMDTRGIVALSGITGYVKRYAYDRCAATRPPPYFPTTGRFADNRFYEIDPVKFNQMGVYNYFKGLSAGP